MKFCVVFAHGWGFDASVWDEVLALLPDDVAHVRLDFGFTGAPDFNLPSNDIPVICVGHSLGALWLLKHVFNPVGFVAINGFDCFHRYVDVAQIEAMEAGTMRHFEAQMKGFYRACGVPVDLRPSVFDRARLLEGLGWLKRLDARLELSRLTCPVVALMSDRDQVIDCQDSLEIWSDHKIMRHESAGHVLPLDDPEFCVRAIQDVIDVSGF